jgi:hypothetical protein
LNWENFVADILEERVEHVFVDPELLTLFVQESVCLFSDIADVGVNLWVNKHTVEIEVDGVVTLLNIWGDCHCDIEINFITSNCTKWNHKGSWTLICDQGIESCDLSVNGLAEFWHHVLNNLVNNLTRHVDKLLKEAVLHGDHEVVEADFACFYDGPVNIICGG